MQNPYPAAGTIPAVDPSSWNSSPNVEVSPRSAGSSKSHDGVVARRHNAQTCDMCFKKKTKCELEGSNLACIECMRRNTKCKFTMRREKREHLKRSQYVKELEDRVSRTEALLKAVGLLDEESSNNEESTDEDGDPPDSDSEPERDREKGQLSSNSEAKSGRNRARRHVSLDHNAGSTTTAGNNDRNSCPSLSRGRSPSSSERRYSGPGNSDLQHVPVLSFDGREESRYYGRSSFMSILSREGIEWIKEKTGDAKFVNGLLSQSSRDSPWDYWRPDVFHDLFDSHVFKPLPPRAEVFSLIKDYFRTINRLFPLYHEAAFMRLVEWQYTQQTCDDAARWASINIILAMAYEYRYSNSLKSEKDRERSWLYFKNAMSVFAELTLRRTDILSVQALLGMAFFLRGNSGTQSALPIITAAMRACHRMGLHRNLPRPYLSPAEQEQRKRVFWVAYILDQSTCGRSGSAPTQHVDDLDVDLPVEEVDDESAMGIHGSFFRHLCRLTVIKGRIYCRLYSTKALNGKSIPEIFRIVDELNTELEEWKRDSAAELQLKLKPAGEDFLLGFGSAGLRFVYYNSMIMIHRIPLIVHFVHSRYNFREKHKTSELRQIADQSAASSAICVQAARDTLKLVNNLPWGDIAWIWSLLYYVFLSVTTIFANFMQDNTHPKAKEDINTLSMASTFFRTLIPGDGPHKYALFMAQMSINFERIARAVIERNEKAVKTRDEPASHGQTTTESTQQSDVSSVADHDEDSPNFTAPDHSAAPSASIPQVEGFPHDVMPSNAKPEPRGTFFSQMPTQNLRTTNPSYTSTTNAPSTNNITPIPQIFNPATATPNTNNLYPSLDATPAPTTAATTAAAPTNNMYTVPGLNTSTFPVPSIWHIPFTADWEFPNPSMEGLIASTNATFNPPAGTGANIPGYPLDLSGADTGLGLGSATASASAPPHPHPPAPPGVDENMAYDYANQMQNMMSSQAQTQAQVQAQVQAQAPHPFMDTDLAWFGGFF